MVAPYSLESSQELVLRCLADLAVRERGYERRGVRGWALLDDVEREVRNRHLYERLPALFRRGFVDRANVAPPGRSRPLWVYRISEGGGRFLAWRDGVTYEPIAEPSPENSGDALSTERWFPARSCAAHSQLVEAWLDATPCPLMDFEPGWRTYGQLLGGLMPAAVQWLEDVIDALERAEEPWRLAPAAPVVPPPFFKHQDLDWMAERGIVRRWGVVPDGWTRHVVLWRLTPLGASLTPLHWHA